MFSERSVADSAKTLPSAASNVIARLRPFRSTVFETAPPVWFTRSSRFAERPGRLPRPEMKPAMFPPVMTNAPCPLESTGVEDVSEPIRATTSLIAITVSPPCCSKKKEPPSEPAPPIVSGLESGIVTETRRYGPAGSVSRVPPTVSSIAVGLVLTSTEPLKVAFAKPGIASTTDEAVMRAARPVAPTTSRPVAPLIVTKLPNAIPTAVAPAVTTVAPEASVACWKVKLPVSDAAPIVSKSPLPVMLTERLAARVSSATVTLPVNWTAGSVTLSVPLSVLLETPVALIDTVPLTAVAEIRPPASESPPFATVRVASPPVLVKVKSPLSL